MEVLGAFGQTAGRFLQIIQGDVSTHQLVQVVLHLTSDLRVLSIRVMKQFDMHEIDEMVSAR